MTEYSDPADRIKWVRCPNCGCIVPRFRRMVDSPKYRCIRCSRVEEAMDQGGVRTVQGDVSGDSGNVTHRH